MKKAPRGSDMQGFESLLSAGEPVARQRRCVESAVSAGRDKVCERLPCPIGLHDAPSAERVRLVNVRCGAAHKSAAVGADFESPPI